MANNTFKSKGTIENYKDDRGASLLINHPVRAIVKDNIDSSKNGRIRVYVAGFGGIDPDDDRNWISVKYMSPWFGIASTDFGINNKAVADYGNFVSNPQSYGFWASAPDIGTEVVCIFINGKPDDGYYIGSIPITGMHHMVPAIAATDSIVANNEAESTMYAGADRLPTSEINYGNPTIQKSPKIFSEPKPIHSYQASILSKQGLIRDNYRGVISSSSQRESPSRVFGISTPGNSIYQGGFNSKTINSAIESASNDDLKQIGRTGGHSIVMDDGTVDGKDQLMRLRTAAGHMIMMNDSGQTLFIIHSNGQSWIELGKEGTIDMFAANSVNIRTMGDLNLHADRDINMNAKRNLNIFAENAKTETKESYTLRTGKDFNSYQLGQFTVKVDGEMSMESKADSSFHSKATNYINGAMIHLNTGAISVVPKEVKELDKTVHVETVYSPNTGWINSPADADEKPLISVANRVPTHQPWIGSNSGVDVKIKQAKPESSPAPSETSSVANSISPNNPSVATSVAAISTIPKVADVKLPENSNALSSVTTGALVSQQSAINSALSNAEKSAQGIVPGVVGVTTEQLSQSGQILKPGTAQFVADKLKLGVPVEQAIGPNLFTGALGVNSAANLVNNVTAQTSVAVNSFKNAATDLLKSGDIKPTDSATQSAGIIAAAAKFGTDVVTNTVKMIGGVVNTATNQFSAISNSTIENIKNSIAGGKAASDLVDKNLSGFSGLSTSISGALTGISNSIKNTVTGVAGAIGGTIKNATALIEKSFGKLSVGSPTQLDGQQSSTDNPSETQKMIQQYDNAVKDEQIALDELFDAKKKYRDNPSKETVDAVQKAEAKLAGIRNSIATSSTKVIGSLGGTNFSDMLGSSSLTTNITNVKNTINSGLNSLPGGASALISKVSATGSNAVNGLKNLVSNTIGDAQNNLDNTIKNLNAGSVLNAAKSAITEASNAASSLGKSLSDLSKTDIAKTANGMLSQLKSSLSSIAGGSSSIKTPVLSSETIDVSSQLSKLGQLLSDSRIPIPNFDNIDFKAAFKDYQEKQSKLQQEIKDLEQQLKQENAALSKMQEEYNPFQTDANAIKSIESKYSSIATVTAKLKEKQLEYDRLIGYNDPTQTNY